MQNGAGAPLKPEHIAGESDFRVYQMIREVSQKTP